MNTNLTKWLFGLSRIHQFHQLFLWYHERGDLVIYVINLVICYLIY